MRWYISLDGATKGPFDRETILAMRELRTVTGSTSCCREGEQEWRNAEFFPELIPDEARYAATPKLNKRIRPCPACDGTVSRDAIACPHCGHTLKKDAIARGEARKAPGIAAVLSFFIAGLGQIYNGHIGIGLLMGLLVYGLDAGGIAMLSATDGTQIFGYVLLFAGIVIHIGCISAAYTDAVNHNAD